MSETHFCESCGALLHDGARFCGACGHVVDAPAPSSEHASVTPSGPPPVTPSGPPPLTPSAAPAAPAVAEPVAEPVAATDVRRNWLIAAVVGALVLAIGLGAVLLAGGGDDGGTDQGTSSGTSANATYLEPVGSVTPGAFTGSIGTVTEKVVTGAPAPSSTQVTGSTVGLYGGSGDAKVCNAEQLITYLQANPAKAKAFGGALGITAAEIPTYVRSLTPVLLTRDTRVTNHGYDNGVATPRQAVLQAGTAVLVDRYGVPRVKCACGNPLAPPSAQPLPTRTVGTPWSGFDRTTVIIVVAAPQAVDGFVVVDVSGSGYIRITVGANGTVTRLSAAEYCALNPTDPACTATTTTAPPTTTTTAPRATTPPTTAPPAAARNTPEDAVAQWIGQQGYSYAGDCAYADPAAGSESLCTTLDYEGPIVRTYLVGFPYSEYVAAVTVTLVADGWWEVSDVQDIGAVG